MLLQELSDVIPGPGDYVTRDGRRVTIHQLNEKKVTFRAQGSIWPSKPGGRRTYEIWHTSGRAFPLRESNRDIVGPWPKG